MGIKEYLEYMSITPTVFSRIIGCSFTNIKNWTVKGNQPCLKWAKILVRRCKPHITYEDLGYTRINGLVVNQTIRRGP